MEKKNNTVLLSFKKDKKEEEEINERFTFYYLNLVLMSFLTNRKKT